MSYLHLLAEISSEKELYGRNRFLWGFIRHWKSCETMHLNGRHLRVNGMSWQLFGKQLKCTDTSFTYSHVHLLLPVLSPSILKCLFFNIICVFLFYIYFFFVFCCLIAQLTRTHLRGKFAYTGFWLRVLRVCWLLVTFFAFFFSAIFCFSSNFISLFFGRVATL